MFKLEEESSHKSATTHTGTSWPFDPKINGFPGLMVDHIYAKFGDPSCTAFWDIVWRTNVLTNRHTT